MARAVFYTIEQFPLNCNSAAYAFTHVKSDSDVALTTKTVNKCFVHICVGFDYDVLCGTNASVMKI